MLVLYLVLSRGAARVVQPFGKATVLKKCSFKLAELLIQKIICLVNQTDQCICGNFRCRRFDIGPIVQIGPILFVGQSPHRLRRGVIFSPQRESTLPQEILIIQQQFFEARASHANEFQFRFL